MNAALMAQSLLTQTYEACISLALEGHQAALDVRSALVAMTKAFAALGYHQGGKLVPARSRSGGGCDGIVLSAGRAEGSGGDGDGTSHPPAVASVEHKGDVQTTATGGSTKIDIAVANDEEATATAAVAAAIASHDSTGAAGAATVLPNGQPLTRERDLDAERDAELYNEQLLDQMLGLDSTASTPAVQLLPKPSRSKFKGSISASSSGRACGGGGGELGGGLGSSDGGESRGSSADDVGGGGNGSRRAQSQVHLDQFRANVDGAFAALESLLADGQQRCDQDIATLRKRRKEHDATFHQQNLEESMVSQEGSVGCNRLDCSGSCLVHAGPGHFLLISFHRTLIRRRGPKSLKPARCGGFRPAWKRNGSGS